ncbi:MAG: SWIM zinc finger family protein [Sandaracinaceae bacterium]|nr:SWIM zinc finger family protein [Sandaracinaceae bacterium]
MRADLLALTDDDLTALSNRGTVRRARAETDAGELKVELTVGEDGTLTAAWSDDTTCTLPAGVSLGRARCTCPAQPPCRHLVRTVMAYRRDTAAPTAASAGSDASAPSGEPTTEADVTAPGSAPAHTPAHTPNELPNALVTRARKLWTAGQLFELTRTAKPVARCHSLGTTTRFLVPGDAHHAVCDCGQPAPCEHAAMALWAFERLAPEAHAGLVDTRDTPYPVPLDALDAVDALLEEWLTVGLASAPTTLLDRTQRVSQEARKAGLVWVAEALAELASEKEAYDQRDARFDAGQTARVFGELALRSGVTRADRGTVPPVFVRGVPADRTLQIPSSKLVGLGCAASIGRTGVSLHAFVQDEDTGQVFTLVKDAALRSAAGTERPLHELARATVGKGITLANVAMGRTLAKGAKRSASGVLSLGRSPAACSPQTFSFERLRAPVLAEGFAEVDAHLAQLPPKPLRPRKLAEDVHVVPLRRAGDVRFLSATQETVALLEDPVGGTALLRFPFHERAAAGTEALLRALSAPGLVFVSGRFRRGAQGLVVEPTLIVSERDGVRRAVAPWIEAPSDEAGAHARGRALDRDDDGAHFLADELADAMGEAAVVGTAGWTPGHRRAFTEHARRADSLGLVDTARWLAELADAPSARRVLRLSALATWAEGREP